MKDHRYFRVSVLALASVLFLATAAAAEPPLLVPGKSTLYQRLIVHPGAYKYSQPDSPKGDSIVPFTVYYIYETRESNGISWHLCATNTVGRDKVWVRGDAASSWNKALVLLLSGANDRKPLMFFKNKTDIESVAKMDNVNQTIANIEKQFKEYLRTGTVPPPDFPVVALEPDFRDGMVPYNRFYLMPIFSYDDTIFDEVMLLEVASIDPGSDAEVATLDPADRLASALPGPGVPGYAATASKIVASSLFPRGLGHGRVPGPAGTVGRKGQGLSDERFRPLTPLAPLAQAAGRVGESTLLASNSRFLPLAAPAAGGFSFDSPVLVAQNSGGVTPNRMYIAFVIDTTVSMGPYIEQALDISREFYVRIIQEGLEDYVALAVVAFRSSVEAAPRTEYTTRIISDFKDADERDSFLQALGRVREARYSTHAFSEDSFAGLETAIYDLSWPVSDDDGKVIVLITDAGPLPPSDPWRATNHTPWSLGGLAKSQGINIVPIHVKTWEGRRNHGMAEDAYRSMADAAGEYDTYIDINANAGRYTSDTFGTAADTIFLNLEENIKAIRDYRPSGDQGQSTQFLQTPTADPGQGDSPGASPGPSPGASPGGSAADLFADRVAPFYPPEDLTPGQGPGASPPPADPASEAGGRAGKDFAPPPQALQDSSSRALMTEAKISSRPNNDDPAVAKAAEVGQRIGLSIRLNYLGSVNKVKAPTVVKSWIADKDISLLAGDDGAQSKEVPTVEVAVLITKNQLSSLSSQLKIIMEEADKALDTQARDFFQSILSASAQIANDPQAFALKPETKLGDLGVMGEFLDDLPYKSVIMGKTEQDWYNMSFIEQDNFIRVLKSKVDLYAQYDLDVNNWAKFDEDNSGDWLYRVPLTMLP
ncbi:MAG: hypothetical protein LBF58_02585 [Deltaproteobacteria bacterium]|jgi:hypothetical protein|nr:hypothetical protein [Deltaproteobacteria bacterium]